MNCLSRIESRAFTLIEVLVCSAVSAIAIAMAYQLYYGGMKRSDHIKRYIEALEGTSILLSYLEMDLKQMRSVPVRDIDKYSYRLSEDSRSISIRKPHERGRQKDPRDPDEIVQYQCEAHPENENLYRISRVLLDEDGNTLNEHVFDDVGVKMIRFETDCPYFKDVMLLRLRMLVSPVAPRGANRPNSKALWPVEKVYRVQCPYGIKAGDQCDHMVIFTPNFTGKKDDGGTEGGSGGARQDYWFEADTSPQ